MASSVVGKYSVECAAGAPSGDAAVSFSRSGVDVTGGVAVARFAAFLALRFIHAQMPAMAESRALKPPTMPPTIAPTLTFFFVWKVVVDSPVGMETVGMLMDGSLKVYDGSEKENIVAVALAPLAVAVTSAGSSAAAASAAWRLKPFPEATSR